MLLPIIHWVVVIFNISNNLIKIYRLIITYIVLSIASQKFETLLSNLNNNIWIENQYRWIIMNIFLDFILQSINLFSYQQLLFVFTDFRVKYEFWSFKFSSPTNIAIPFFSIENFEIIIDSHVVVRHNIGKFLAHFAHFFLMVTFFRIIVYHPRRLTLHQSYSFSLVLFAMI